MLLLETTSGPWEAFCMMKSILTVILWSTVWQRPKAVWTVSLTKRGWLEDEGGTSWDAGVAFQLLLCSPWPKTSAFRNWSMESFMNSNFSLQNYFGKSWPHSSLNNKWQQSQHPNAQRWISYIYENLFWETWLHFSDVHLPLDRE